MHTHAPSWIIVSSKAAANISYSALVPAVIFTGLASVTVILRWYSRAWLSRGYGLEDILVTVALLLSIAMTAVVGGEFEIDTNTTNDEVRASLLETMMKLVFAQSIFYHFAINFVKISILLQYWNIFNHVSKACIWACLLLFLMSIIAAGWGVAGVIFLCTPIRKYWEPNILGHCIDPGAHFWSTAIIGIILDFAIWLLPMPVLGKLHLPTKQRIGLLVPFGLGAFVCAVSILRLVLVHDAAEKGNVTKSGTHAVIWSTVEVNVAIISASLLVMKPLFVRLMPKLMVDTEPQSSGDDARDFRRWLTVSTLNDPSLWKEDGLPGRLRSLDLHAIASYVWTDSSSETRVCQGGGEGGEFREFRGVGRLDSAVRVEEGTGQRGRGCCGGGSAA